MINVTTITTPPTITSRLGCLRRRGLGTLLLLLTLHAPRATAAAECAHPLDYYGTYSLGTVAGAGRVSLADRVREARALGANMIVGTGPGTEVPDALPEGMLAVPGCSLMYKRDWQKDGQWDEAQARVRLGELATRFGHHPRVYGVCITHEVTEFADHARRRWMYRLAKEYFPDKKVIQYYGRLWDQENPRREKVYGYGLGGEVETDVLFVSLQGATRDGRFRLANAKRLDDILRDAARTPGIPVWGQTSINADHKYVTGPESMRAVWGEHGERMALWADALLGAPRAGSSPRLSGFFWRSLGRFPWDLGYPDFAEHRAQVRAIGKKFCTTS